MNKEEIEALIEMRNNCLNASVYDDEKRLLKSNAITRALMLEQENKDLKEDRKVLFEENHNKEQVIIKYQDNWDKLKLWTKKAVDKYYDSDIRIEMVYENVLNKMQELEKGE